MKISHNWLKTFIDINEPVEEISELLTQTGLEVEGIETFEQVKGGLKGVVIGEVLTCEKHPNADKLSKTTVDIGNGVISPIVCGAPNVAVGQKVLVATVNTVLHPTDGEEFKIKKSKIRGEVSEGMICAEDELGLGTSHDGILVLETDLANGTPAAQYFNLEDDHVYEIGLTPNRADGASHYGVSRDLKAVLKREIKFDIPQIPTSEEFPLSVKVENQEACPRYSGIVLDQVKVQESPKWLKQALSAIGLTPINNVVDVTNFICHGLGQPLHAFDYNHITGEEVIVKTMPAGSKFTTLDEKERELFETDLMICNKEEGMCIAGVFGGIKSGVSDATSKIFLESAYFSPDYVRKTSLNHTLKTDASFRYERGTDPNMTVDALKVAVNLLMEVAGANVASGIYDLYENPIDDFVVPVKYRNVNRLIGKIIEKDEIKEILSNLDIKLRDMTDEGFTAIVPPYRVDVTREADITEEILRIHGFNNIEVDDSNGADYLSDFEEREPNKIRRSISNILTGFGFREILTNSMTNPGYVENTDGLSPEENIHVLNKLSEELGILRQTLIYGGLESIAHNVNRKYTNLKFFEFGKSYFKKGEKYVEDQQLALFITGNKEDENWLTEQRNVSFYDISSAARKVLAKFNFVDTVSEPTEAEYFSYGLDVKHNNKILCRLGRLQDSVTKQTGVKQEVFYAEFNWDYLVKKHTIKIDYQPIPKFPEVRKDLSLILDKSVTFESVKKVAFQSERKLLKKINVFSVYEGEQIGENKKSYAISFTLHDPSKNLNDKQIDKSMNQLIKAFEQKINAIIRKKLT
ncbi:MAG: phenylalanine--tRNA ligase subunit beta [Bacteroidota bacterium]